MENSQDFIRANCGECNKRVKVPPRLAGRAVKCPRCNAAIPIPQSAESKPEDAWLDDTETQVAAEFIEKVTVKPEEANAAVSPANTVLNRASTSANSGNLATPKNSFDVDDLEISVASLASSSQPDSKSVTPPTTTPPSNKSAADDDDFKFVDDASLPERRSLPPLGADVDDVASINLGEFDLADMGPPASDLDAFDAASVSAALNDAKKQNDQFRFSCKVCGTSLYASPSQIGDLTTCPDCYSEFSIPRPTPRPAKQKFTPEPGSNIAMQDATGQNRREHDSKNADELLKRAELELKSDKEKREQESYDFDTHNFAQRTLGYLADPSVYPMALAPGFLFGLVLAAAQFVWDLGGQARPELARVGVVLIMIGFGVPLLGMCLVNGLAILEATANRLRRVSQWPAFNIGESLGEVFMLVVVAGLSALPGGLIGYGLQLAGHNSFLITAVTLTSTWILLPIVLLSVLSNQSIMEPINGDVISSISKKPDAWAGMYLLNGLATFAMFTLFVGMIDGSATTKMICAMISPLLVFFIFRQLGNLAAAVGDVTNIEFDLDDENEQVDEE